MGKFVSFGGLAALLASAASASLPGCPSSDPATNTLCIISQDLVDIYNARQGAGLAHPGINNQKCTAIFRQQMHNLAQAYMSDVSRLQKQGDKTPQIDAAKLHEVQYRNALNKYEGCYLAPKPLRAVPAITD